MTETESVIHDGPTDTTPLAGADHGARTLADAARPVADSLRRRQDITLPSPFGSEVRVLAGVWPNARQLLALRVEDGHLVAEYDPADLNEAAEQFVDEVRKRWTTEMDDAVRFTAGVVAEVLADAARAGGDPSGETVSVQRAADVMATLMWGRR